MLKQQAIDYFDAFKKADIVRLKNLLSEDVALRDWNVDASGKESVSHEFSSIFNNLSCINVLIVNMYEDNKTIIAELTIVAKEIGAIKVVDIITFDEHSRINSIRAYKG